jgi:hypothetical protein
VTLGDQSSLRGLVLRGPNQPVALQDHAGRGGNVVAVASRGQNDTVSATIVQCELINRIKSGGGTDGPTGGAILAYTRNPKLGPAPLVPHVGARVTVALTSSIVRATDGKAVFAMNFASGGQVVINLRAKGIGGPLDVVGGLARPDAVVGAATTVTSTGNHYSPQPGGEAVGWQITGGSTPPFLSPVPVPNSNADSNSASANSTDDQIEDFQDGIAAVGGRRLDPNHGPCSDNTVNLTLTGMTLATNANAAAATDFEFAGALSLGPFSVGDNNAVIVDVLAGHHTRSSLSHRGPRRGFGTGTNSFLKGTLAASNTLTLVKTSAGWERPAGANSGSSRWEAGSQTRRSCANLSCFPATERSRSGRAATLRPVPPPCSR